MYEILLGGPKDLSSFGNEMLIYRHFMYCPQSTSHTVGGLLKCKVGVGNGEGDWTAGHPGEMVSYEYSGVGCMVLNHFAEGMKRILDRRDIHPVPSILKIQDHCVAIDLNLSSPDGLCPSPECPTPPEFQSADPILSRPVLQLGIG